MKNWFKRHKKTLLVLAMLIGGPSAVIYIEGADAVIDAADTLKEQGQQGGNSNAG